MNRAVDTFFMGPGRWWRMVGAAGTAVVVGAGVLAAPVLPAAAAPVGQVTEFSAGITANSRPAGIAAGPDGNLWFTESNGNRIGRITPAGAVTEFTAAGTPTGIAAGPDGNLWFTEFLGKKIGRITPAGVVTEFSAGITPADGYPSGIAAGPDGNLWFTEPNGNRIGRITTAGVVTEFSAGITAGSFPTSIVAGPDGNMWFTESSGNRIGRITPAGVVTESSIGITAGSSPYGIAAGPDGNLWFTESTGNRIGRITPAGAVTEFSTGITAGSGLRDIAAGPDGNMWFAELEGQRVGRITPAGVVTEFSAGITALSNPLGIAAGPDGNLWFTESLGSRIGRIGADVPAPPAPDSTAPTAAMTGPGATTLASRAAVGWTGTDAVGVSSYDMRYRTAAWNRTLGGYVNPAALQQTTARSTTQPIALGALYCMSVRARDAAGNVSAWSAERCTAKPLDDRSLRSKGAWAKTRGKVYFAGTIATAKTKGASLTRAGALPGRVALIASKGKGFGKVGIYYNGKLVRKVNLAATKTKTRQVIALPRLAKKGTIMVKVLTARRTVKVDGLLTARR
jgi:streptogramin lyase